MRTLLAVIMLALYAAPASAQKAMKQAAPSSGSKPVKEEVAKPIPFNDQELRVIRSATKLPDEKLLDLLRTYEKGNNEAMAQILARQLLKRDPKQPDAMRILGEISPDEEVRPANYMDMVIKDLRAGRKVDDPETVVSRARVLVEEARAAEAVTLLEKLQSVNYSKVPFPFNEELGYAYRSAGLLDKAEESLKAALRQTGNSAEEKREIEKELAGLTLDKRIASLRAQAAANPAEALEQAVKLRKEMPSDPDVIAYYLEALQRAGRNQEAVAMLEDMKRKSKDAVFVYQDELAFVYLNAKSYDKARAAFREIAENSGFDRISREEARAMLIKVTLAEKLERGQAALQRGDAAGAKAILDELENQFPKNDDVTGLRSIWMAKTGHADEALTMLLLNKQKAANERRLFTQQGALADLYMERKEFNLARIAYEDIINNVAYDQETRAEAAVGVNNARCEKLLGQGYLAINDSHLATAKDIGEALSLLAPNDPEVMTYMADLKLATGHPKEANAMFEAIKSRYYAGRPFPGQDGIASSLSLTGQWEQSYAAFSEILERQGYSAEEVFSAGLQRRQLRPFFMNTVRPETSFMQTELGRAYRETLSYSTSWLNNWRGIFSVRQDNIYLKDDRVIIPSGRSSIEGQFALQRRFDGGYFAEGLIGGALDNVLYGARFGKLSPNGTSWSLGYSGNERATDYSLPLEVLNGRANRIELKVAGPITNRLLYDFTAYAESVSVGGQRLGRGYGITGSIGLTLQQETRLLPEIVLAYVGEYTGINPASDLPQKVLRQARGQDLEVRRALDTDQDLKAALPANYGNEIFNSIVAREVNRHGFDLTVRKRFTPSKSVYAQIGTYYDFIDRSLNYTLAAGMEWGLSDSSFLYAELRYDSNGRGASSGGGFWEANLGAQMTF